MFTHRIFTLTLFIVLLALLTSGPAIAQVRTVRVSPDPSATPDPLVSGQNLLDALAAVPATPERWLLDIEPGVYDLDGRTLTLRNRIDLEGSGRGLTVIRSTGTTVIDCPAGVTAELRELTIAGVNSGLTNASDGLRVTRVDIDLVDPGTYGIGLSSSGRAQLREITITIPAAPEEGCEGMHLSGDPIVRDVRIEITDPSGQSWVYGIGIGTGRPDIDGATVVMRGSLVGVGVFASPWASARIAGSTVDVDAFDAYGIFYDATSVWRDVKIEIRDCEITAASAESFSAVGIATFGEIVIETSKVEGWSYSIEGFDPPIWVAGSRLAGTVYANNNITCVNVYDADFEPLSNTCQ